MGDEVEISEGPETERGSVSRRNALKAGVAVGVGAAVWSGVSITSLGGTPAYAAGCTFAIFIDLTGEKGCRNTDQGNSGSCGQKPPPANLYGYHPLKNTGLPTGFSITNNIAEGTCCTDVPPLQDPPAAPYPPTFNFPSDLKCLVTIEFSNASDGKCGANPFLVKSFGTPNPLPPPAVLPADTGPIYIPLECYAGVQSNSFYTIYAKCVGDSNPPECVQP